MQFEKLKFKIVCKLKFNTSQDGRILDCILYEDDVTKAEFNEEVDRKIIVHFIEDPLFNVYYWVKVHMEHKDYHRLHNHGYWCLLSNMDDYDNMFTQSDPP